MEKSTEINPSLLSEIKARRSGRAYSTKTVETEKLHTIIDAARWAPSSMNEQPWRYILAVKENKELYDKIFVSLASSNQVWVKNAPVLLVSFAKKTLIKNGNPNRHALYDTGAANALLSIQAVNFGLMVHQMGGFDYNVLKNNLKLSDDFEIAAVLSIGYSGDINELPEGYKTRETAPRERYSFSEIVATNLL